MDAALDRGTEAAGQASGLLGELSGQIRSAYHMTTDTRDEALQRMMDNIDAQTQQAVGNAMHGAGGELHSSMGRQARLNTFLQGAQQKSAFENQFLERERTRELSSLQNALGRQEQMIGNLGNIGMNQLQYGGKQRFDVVREKTPLAGVMGTLGGIGKGVAGAMTGGISSLISGAIGAAGSGSLAGGAASSMFK
jgi:hypothetical protein